MLTKLTNAELVCHLSSVLAEILAYLSIVAYIALIVRVVNGKGAGVLIFMTSLAPAAILFTKVPAAVGLLMKHVSLRTGALFSTSMLASWTLQAMLMGQIRASVAMKVTMCVVNVAIMIYFIVSTSRFSRSELYMKCKSGIFF
jgi:riboflavin transporter FmnP